MVSARLLMIESVTNAIRGIFFVMFPDKSQVGVQGRKRIPAREGTGVNDKTLDVAGSLDKRVNDGGGCAEVCLAQWAIGFQYRDTVLLIQAGGQHDQAPCRV